MKPRTYIETTIPSYLTAWPSKNVVMAGHQQTTKEWWDVRRHQFDLYISQFVIDEASAGDSEAAERRLTVLEGLQLLEPSEEAYSLADALLRQIPLPEKAATDSLHIAIAAVNGMDYLMTWNCTHIANATLRAAIESICREAGFEPPVICTPEELLKE